jgi:hypothetical protein
MIRIISSAAVFVALSLSSLIGAQAGPRFDGGYSHFEHSDYSADRHDFRDYRVDRHDERGYHDDRADHRFDRREDRRYFRW